MRRENRGGAAFLMLMFLFFVSVLSQPIPDSIRIAVTYYDYHSNGSCPDFNPPDDKDYVTLKMVQPTLDTFGRPVRGTRVYFSQYIENWFRPWSEHTFKNRKPTYNFTGDPNTSAIHGTMISEKQVEYDTVYKNVTIEDSLTFKHIGLGVYQYKNSAFFPLDNRGFGKEASSVVTGASYKDHNYSFSMIIERMFLYRKGLKFRFEGDDDVWVFINNKLALDLGGIHMAEVDSFALDDIAGSLGLVLNTRYKLTFLFCERQANECHIWITTNLIYAPPNQLKLIVLPNDTIMAGDTVTGMAEVWSDTGQVFNYPGKITWSWKDLLAFNRDTTFKILSDEACRFIPSEAHTNVKIVGRYDYDTTHFGDSVIITVIPNVPDRCVIEATPDKPPYGSVPEAPLWDNWPRDSIIINPGVSSNEDFYAILRDRFGNWIGPGNPISWSVLNDKLARAESGTDPAKGQGRAVRVDWSKHASTLVTGTYDSNGKLLPGDVIVHLEAETYKVSSACYVDTNNRPDGYVDQIHVRLNKNMPALTNDIVQKFIDNSPSDMLPQYRYFTLNNVVIISNNEFHINVRQNKGSFGNAQTSVDTRDILKIGSFTIDDVGFIESTVTPIVDSLGPVIISAEYFPGYIANINQTVRDTMKVYFSEKVIKPQNEKPFMFYDSINNLEYELGLDNSLSPADGSTMSFFKKSFVTKKAPENGDKICIKSFNELGNIVAIEDLIHNYYVDRRTIWAPIKVHPAKFKIEVIVSGPNLIIPDTVKKILKITENGILFKIRPIVNEGSTINYKDVSGYLTVYDPLGNLIVKNLKSLETDQKVFYIFWNAKNLAGRDVASSMYVGFISIKGDNIVGADGVIKKFIGVQRGKTK